MRRNTLITGASAGLGEGMARVLAAQGHHLALAARRIDRLEQLREDLLAKHPGIDVSVHAVDVDEPSQVFEGVAAAIDVHGQLDRVIVNAGVGTGARVGTGAFEENQRTIRTNVTGALAQCEAAMEHFYARRAGHLVLISSLSALRGMPGSMNTYAASKAMVAHLAEGIRADLIGRDGLDIAVTTLFPGYIASQMNKEGDGAPPFLVSTDKGCQALVAAILKEPATARVPGWPWRPVGTVLKYAPLKLVRRLV